MKFICYGDSNTFGYDPRGYFGGEYDRPWPEILSGMPGCTAVNWGENGREIPGGRVAFPEEADLVILMLGTNDLLQGASAEEACRKMERFVRSLQRARLLLIAPPPLKPGAWVASQRLLDESNALAEHYRGLSKRLGIRFLDSGEWNLPVCYDGVHLTEEGHRIFAESLYKELSKP